jgi:hypothetical protein
LAILQAAQSIKLERAQSGQGATLRELVQRSQVGYKVARQLVNSLHQRGQLSIVGTQQVEYRNRPVSLYVPAVAYEATSNAMHDLGRAMSYWVQRD